MLLHCILWRKDTVEIVKNYHLCYTRDKKIAQIVHRQMSVISGKLQMYLLPTCTLTFLERHRSRNEEKKFNSFLNF